MEDSRKNAFELNPWNTVIVILSTRVVWSQNIVESLIMWIFSIMLKVVFYAENMTKRSFKINVVGQTRMEIGIFDKCSVTWLHTFCMELIDTFFCNETLNQWFGSAWLGSAWMPARMVFVRLASNPGLARLRKSIRAKSLL